jgi:glycosyltransferase involved in cell wall biosynthesis
MASIVIPVYNGENYLREAIDSALAQVYNNLEVLVVNDGSTDDTEKIALSYGDKIRYFAKENGGVSSALNLGIQNMRGEYFSWLSHDDKYFPDKISSQIAHLAQARDKTSIVFSGYAFIDSKGKELHRVSPLEKYAGEQLSTPLFALLHRQINGICVLVHKSHFERAGLFREDLRTTQDIDLWFRMMRGREILCCPGVTAMSRIHPRQTGIAMVELHSEECDRLWIGVMEALTDAEKVALDGSAYRFYKNVYGFLCYTSYQKAIAHAKRRLLEELRKENNVARYAIKLLGLSFLRYGILAREFGASFMKNGPMKTMKRARFAVKRLSVRK